jgi:hypothetical protein
MPLQLDRNESVTRKQRRKDFNLAAEAISPLS